MAELKTGDTVPSDCTAVGKLPVRMLTSTDGALAYADGTGVTSLGKLLLSSREQDYRDAFSDNGLTICDDDELGYDFCAASSPLRLPVRGGTRLQVALFGCFSGLAPYATSPEIDYVASSRAVYASALRRIMATVTKGGRKILFYGEDHTAGTGSFATFLSTCLFDVDFTGWSTAGVSLNPATSTDVAAYKAAITDPDVSILVNMYSYRDVRAPFAAYDCATVMNTITTELRAHVEAGGGWIDTNNSFATTGLLDYDPDHWIGPVDPITLDVAGDRYGLPYLYDMTWLATVFPGLTMSSTVYYDPALAAPGYTGQEYHYTTGLTAAGSAMFSDVSPDPLALPLFEYEPGYFTGSWFSFAHFGGDLNGMQVLGLSAAPSSYSGAFTGSVIIGGIPSFSALA